MKILLITLIALSVNANNKSPILQPGAPGEATTEISAEMATDIANSSYTTADVYFMQGMIVHHEQALTMSKLAKQRTNSKTCLLYTSPSPRDRQKSRMPSSA